MEWNKKAIVRCAAALAVGALIIWAFGSEIALFLTLVLGGGAVAFILSPLCAFYEKKCKRPLAVMLAVLSVVLALAAIVLLLVPVIVRQARQILADIPEIRANMEVLFGRVSRLAKEQGLLIDPASIDWSTSAKTLLSGAGAVAQRATGFFFRVGLSMMLGVFFLIERDRILLQLELLVPQKYRKLAIRMAKGSVREVRGYLRGQGTVCVIVGALAALGLWIVGIDAPVALGLFVGVMNIVPYFGPIIGGVPVVLTALGQGLIPAVMAAGVLFLVQQLDGMLISPRVMNGVTGLDPITIVLALALGGNRMGIVGILLALPFVLIVRFCYRVWATRHETIEICEKV